jgi:hypothetical protein
MNNVPTICPSNSLISHTYMMVSKVFSKKHEKVENILLTSFKTSAFTNSAAGPSVHPFTTPINNPYRSRPYYT